MRILYRIQQFWNAWRATPDSKDLDEVRATLSPALLALFMQMQAGEQFHSLAIFHRLVRQGEKQPELLEAALLHDVGKTRYPLQPWERALIVLGQAWFPRQVKNWGVCSGCQSSAYRPGGWKKPFIIAMQHPTWGAAMVAQAGASALTAALIQRHQDTLEAAPYPLSPKVQEEQLLRRLQFLDNQY